MSTPQETTEQINPPSHTFGKKRRLKRRFLLTVGPVVVAVAASYIYLTGGRFVSTDNAYIQADKVVISAEVSGSVVAVMVEENDYVAKDTPLFKIDDRSYKIALQQAEARLQEVLADIRMQKVRYRQKLNELELAQSDIDFAKKEYTRQTTLDSNQAVAKAQLDDARHNFTVSQFRRAIIKNEMEQILARLEGDPEISDAHLAGYRLAQAVVEKASLDLERTVVLAPFDGRVSKVPQAGKHVDPGTSVMSLIAETSFWIEANLKETALTRVQPGQKVSIEIDTYPDQTFAGTVQSISPGTGSEYSIIPAQNATGNWVKVVQRIPVRISVEENSKDQLLRAGLSTSVRIDTGYHRPIPLFVQKGLAALGMTGNALAAFGDAQ